MKLLKFYFDPKAGLRTPSKTFELLSSITCWIFNIVGLISAVCGFFGIIIITTINSPVLGLTLGVLSGLICAIVILALFKFLGWLSAIGFTCRAVTLAAHEKILNTDFTSATAAPVASSPAEPEKPETPKKIEFEYEKKTEFEYEQKPPKQYVAWSCRHCGTSNSGYQNFCIKCNKLKDE